MLSSFAITARTLFIPLLLLTAAVLTAPQLLTLPPAHHSLAAALPYAAAALALIVALLLDRGRVACIAVLLMLGCWGLTLARANVAGAPFFSDTLITACSILLPLNLTIFSLLRERSLFGASGLLRLGWIGLQVGAVIWLVWSQRTDILALLSHDFLPISLAAYGVALPQSAVLVSLLGFAVLAYQTQGDSSPLSSGLLVLMVAIFLACNEATTWPLAETYLTAGGLILATGLVLHTHYIAYRDDLTGLPARRALNERLESLGRRYVIAMLDVDHFKKFNDTYGHDVGDQVLRMVAARLRRVRGGGKAYRYGGEEFTIVFPGRDEDYAEPYLEEVREAVADYAMALRSKDRPADGKAGRQKRGTAAQQQSVSVTISIGMASRSAEHRDPEAVVKAADQALYRAKQAGRNRLST